MMDLREQRRVETRRAIQAHAIRLFAEVGYDATTVIDVAKAAGVSPMTLYRHFPTKEDLVLYDEFGAVIADAIQERAPDEPLPRRICRALVDTAAAAVTEDRELLLARLRLMIAVPALRARHLDSQYAQQEAIVEALAPADEFCVRCTASACLGAAHIALVHWTESDGQEDLPNLVRQALSCVYG